MVGSQDDRKEPTHLFHLVLVTGNLVQLSGEEKVTAPMLLEPPPWVLGV